MPAKSKKRPRDLVHGARDRGRGRPTRLTRGLIASYSNHVRLGMYPETAAALEGVPRSTHLGWLERGAKDLQDGRRSIYAELSDALRKASAEVQQFDLGSLAVIQRRAEGWDPGCKLCEKKGAPCGGHRVDLKTAAQIVQWRLSRRFPELWNVARVRLDGVPRDLEAGEGDRGGSRLTMYVPEEEPEG